MLSNQQITREWWDKERNNFHLFVSQAVLAEAYLGDPEAAGLRAQFLSDIEVLQIRDELEIISGEYLRELKIPEKSAVDALHLAYAVIYEVDYLLTWNCKHLAHGEVRKKLKLYNDATGLKTPEIVTPYELMGRSD